MNNQPPEYLQGNVDAWQQEAASYVAAAEHAWATHEPHWGIWRIPETSARLLPDDMSGLNCIELGCGTAYVSAWMCRRGARVIGIDPTPNQLETARRLKREYGLDFAIEHGFAESVPYPDENFISRFPSTARLCGLTPTAGSRKPRAFSNATASWFF